VRLRHRRAPLRECTPCGDRTRSARLSAPGGFRDRRPGSPAGIGSRSAQKVTMIHRKVDHTPNLELPSDRIEDLVPSSRVAA
jgi:hypothetical protein